MDELARRFADLAQQYGPGVIDAAKAAARTEALSCLASALLATVFAGGLILGARLLWRYGRREDEEIAIAGSVLIAVIALIILLIPAWSLIDPWTWTALYHPEVWIAHKTLKI
jgi:MFS family permease